MSGVWSTAAKDAPKVWKFFLQTQPCAAAGVALARNNVGRVNELQNYSVHVVTTRLKLFTLVSA